MQSWELSAPLGTVKLFGKVANWLRDTHHGESNPFSGSYTPQRPRRAPNLAKQFDLLLLLLKFLLPLVKLNPFAFFFKLGQRDWRWSWVGLGLGPRGLGARRCLKIENGGRVFPFFFFFASFLFLIFCETLLLVAPTPKRRHTHENWAKETLKT